MDDLGVARAGVRADRALGLEDDDSRPAWRGARDGQPDHARADHDDVELVEIRRRQSGIPFVTIARFNIFCTLTGGAMLAPVAEPDVEHLDRKRRDRFLQQLVVGTNALLRDPGHASRVDVRVARGGAAAPGHGDLGVRGENGIHVERNRHEVLPRIVSRREQAGAARGIGRDRPIEETPPLAVEVEVGAEMR